MDETGIQYASVLPIQKVLDPWSDILLAYEVCSRHTLPLSVQFARASEQNNIEKLTVHLYSTEAECAKMR